MALNFSRNNFKKNFQNGFYALKPTLINIKIHLNFFSSGKIENNIDFHKFSHSHLRYGCKWKTF